jgi:quercetin dioxygenase-like cupin family protein
MDKKRARNSVDSLKGTVIDLSALLDYQKNSIVSREVISRKAGTVTMFAFARGQGLSEHTAPFDALVIVADGEAMITVSGKAKKVKKNQMIIMPAGAPHSLKAEKRFKMLLVMVKDTEDKR